MIESKFKGHDIICKDGAWLFKDTNELVSEKHKEVACGYCNANNTEDDHDGCIGRLPGVINACCGHGIENDSYIQFSDKFVISGKKATVIINRLLELRK